MVKKKAYSKIVRKTIYKNITRYIALVIIVALGVGFLSGIFQATPEMQRIADEYYDEMNTFDIRINSLLGFKEEDKEKFYLSGVKEVEFIKTLDSIVTRNNEQVECRLIQDVLNINNYTLVSGRKPIYQNEILVDDSFSKDDIPIGSLIYIDNENITLKQFIVVGKVKSVLAINKVGDFTNVGDGVLDAIVYLKSDVFDLERFTVANIVLDNTKEINSCGSVYQSYVNNYLNTYEKFFDLICQEDYDELYQEAYDDLSTAQTDLDAAKLKLADAKSDLEKGEKDLAKGEKDLLRAKKDLAEKEQELDDQISDLAHYYAYLYGGRPSTYVERINNSNDVKEAREKLEEGKTTISEAEIDIENAKVDIENAKIDIDDGYAEIAINQQKVDDAFEDLNDIEAKYTYTTREDIIGLNSFNTDSDIVLKISLIFPVFFFLVTGLVIASSITRLIEEDRSQIGCMKSLGYDNKKILLVYLFYTISAWLIGSILGILFGYKVLMQLLCNAYNVMYDFDFSNLIIYPSIVSLVVCCMLIIVFFTTIITVMMSLRNTTASLLIPKAPKPGKRILLEKIAFIWKRLNFSKKVTFRNLFRYKIRFWMTILGISGCVALTVTGLGINDSIQGVANKEYSEVIKYNVSAKLDDEEDLTALENEYIDDFIMTYSETVYVNSEKIKMYVFNGDNVEDYINLNGYNQQGIAISTSLARKLDLKLGDEVDLTTSSKKDKIIISSIFENYLEDFVVVDKYFEPLNFDTALIKTNSPNKLILDLLSDDNILYSIDNQTIIDNFNNSMESLSQIVYLIVVLAILLEIVVLYNLININICEREKELATIEVLGFYNKEINSYIFREIKILTLFGIIIGIPFGYLLHYFIIKNLESTNILFIHNINYISVIFSCIITYVIMLIVNLFMKRFIKSISMVEALKAID